MLNNHIRVLIKQDGRPNGPCFPFTIFKNIRAKEEEDKEKNIIEKKGIQTEKVVYMIVHVCLYVSLSCHSFMQRKQEMDGQNEGLLIVSSCLCIDMESQPPSCKDATPMAYLNSGGSNAATIVNA